MDLTRICPSGGANCCRVTDVKYIVTGGCCVEESILIVHFMHSMVGNLPGGT